MLKASIDYFATYYPYYIEILRIIESIKELVINSITFASTYDNGSYVD